MKWFIRSGQKNNPIISCADHNLYPHAHHSGAWKSSGIPPISHAKCAVGGTQIAHYLPLVQSMLTEVVQWSPISELRRLCGGSQSA
jgi:hypothetical protein